jgi:hypothetical protein
MMPLSLVVLRVVVDEVPAARTLAPVFAAAGVDGWALLRVADAALPDVSPTAAPTAGITVGTVDDPAAVVSDVDCRDEVQLTSVVAAITRSVAFIVAVINCSGYSVGSRQSAVPAALVEGAFPRCPE